MAAALLSRVSYVARGQCAATCRTTGRPHLSRGAGPVHRFRPLAALTKQLADAAEADLANENGLALSKEADIEEYDTPGLSTEQVQTMLTILNSTDIAEVELKLDSFTLKVRRSIKNGTAAGGTSTVPMPVPGQLNPKDVVLQPLPPVSLPSFDEDDSDESLVYVKSPKVGVMRRGKYVKGKKIGKDTTSKEGDKVKQGQTLCYIEQLGTFLPVQSPQAGELVGFIVEEGEAVEYKQHIIELAPFFGGHIIGDKKNA